MALGLAAAVFSPFNYLVILKVDRMFRARDVRRALRNTLFWLFD
ncbi:hypothetical protein K788_00009215 (plasmid) [Paraburkholderia caribensis MBA4]|uniref:Uncharacterized protein n=1 Tax=Paraburkholderia caribensis MBA4 TaxID=1323664 RepID=A0A0N7JWA3_9BURK|nr:hypothetical protein K788_00009215 [Paraburkholderia caribensis MBA4]